MHTGVQTDERPARKTDKLDFLIQALVKTSRMEVGAVSLEKKDVPLFGTLAAAMSGIVYSAEKSTSL